MNTARWLAWVAMQRQSDATLVQIATMAAAALLIWESMRQVPEHWRERARSAYLLGLLILYAYLLGGQMSITDWSLLLFGLMFLVGGALALRSAHVTPKADDAPEASLSVSEDAEPKPEVE